ncbi:MAG: hypothetical protein OHK0017_00830 [Patescibacteria group bacterium]
MLMNHGNTSSSWPKFQGFIVFGLASLLFFLPLQTLILQFLTKLGFPVWISLWKEVLVLVLITLMLGEIVENLWKTKLNWIKLIRKTWLLWLVLVLTIVALAASFQQVSTKYFLVGFRYSLLWIWFWAVIATWWHLMYNQLRHLENWFRWLFRWLLAGYLIVITFSLALGVFGPVEVFKQLGYGQQLNLGDGAVLTQPTGHVVDASGGEAQNEYRLNSTFSSPNHLAAYLLLMLPFLLGVNLFWSQTRQWIELVFGKILKIRIIWGVLLISNLVMLYLTFARYSYLAMFVLAATLIEITLYQFFKNKFEKNLNWLRVLSWGKNVDLIFIFLIPVLVALVAFNLPSDTLKKYLPESIVKPSSTEWHKQHSTAAIRALTEEKHPDYLRDYEFEPAASWNYRAILLGYGMGAVNPAASVLPLAENPIIRYGIGFDDQYYFPREMNLPLAVTPENWYLGLVLQAGVFFAALYIVFLINFIWPLKQIFQDRSNFNFRSFWSLSLALVLFGIYLGASLLDLFDNQSLALFIGPIWFSYQLLQHNFNRTELDD